MAHRRLLPSPTVDEPEDPVVRNLLFRYRFGRHLASETGEDSGVPELLAWLSAHLGRPVDEAGAEQLLAERRARIVAGHRAWRAARGR